MVSGVIERYGVYEKVEKGDGYHKIMEFLPDGTFTETCGTATASGTYKVSGSSIRYSYSDVSGSGPAYFAIHRSGRWNYQFWKDDSFTLYDFASAALEISMNFEKIEP